MACVGLLGCAQVVGADFGVHEREPGTAPSEGAGGASGTADDDADVPGGQPAAVVGPEGEGGTAGDGSAQGGHAAGEIDCLNGGTVVTLPSTELEVCDCPSGTWGPGCEVVSESM